MFKTSEKLDLAPHKNILFKSRFDFQNKINSKLIVYSLSRLK